MRRLWMVRLGKFGETESRALATGELVTGWNVADLSDAPTRAEIFKRVEAAYPEQKAGTLQSWAVQLNQLRNDMAEGDLVVVPLKTTGEIAIGTALPGYLHVDGAHPTRRVTWITTDLPRDAVKQDLLYSIGATQTVCSISRNDAVTRFEALAKSRRDPGPGSVRQATDTRSASPAPADVPDATSFDLADLAKDQIERFIAANFAGHAFTELVAAILRAQGYQTRVSAPGSDRGVDIVAGQGALGFDAPRLVVQVKSGSVVVDQPTLQSLVGSVTDTHAEHGLLVSWSGFTGAVRQRVNDLYFRVRLWSREDVMTALFSVYERLPEEIRAQLPLRRLWTLVPGEGASD